MLIWEAFQLPVSTILQHISRCLNMHRTRDTPQLIIWWDHRNFPNLNLIHITLLIQVGAISSTAISDNSIWIRRREYRRWGVTLTRRRKLWVRTDRNWQRKGLRILERSEKCVFSSRKTSRLCWNTALKYPIYTTQSNLHSLRRLSCNKIPQWTLSCSKKWWASTIIWIWSSYPTTWGTATNWNSFSTFITVA